MDKIFSKNILKNIILFLAIYLFLYGSYYLLSNGLQPRTYGLQARRYAVCALVVTLAIKLWLSAKLNLKELFVPFGIFLAWCLVYPAAYWVAYHGSQSFIDKHFDHAFACYSLAAFIGMKLLLKNFLPKGLATIISTCVQIFLLIIPLLQVGYYLLYQLPITETGILALLQTNAAEAKEYVMQNLGLLGVVSVVLAFICISYFLYRQNKKFENDFVLLSKKQLVFAFVVFVATGYYSGTIFLDTGILESYGMARDYFASVRVFKEKHTKNFATLKVEKVKPALTKPSSIIMVIGESASREYMSAFNIKAEVDSTPWLREMIEQKQFLKIENGYCCWFQTVPALERALTEKNQYNDIAFNDSVSIIDVARKAGYKTYWFSNQGYISDADTPITLVAQTADKKVWLCDKYFNTDKMVYDGDLLPLLDEVNPNEDNFIVIHLMGSHDDTINRYPPDKARFAKPGKFDTVANYYDSLAYTDDILRDTFTYAKDKLNLQAMVYFSDHGGQPRERRSPDPKGFVSKRIPLVMWFSEEYKTNYPETAKILDVATKRYFTNDLIYDTMANIFQVKSNRVDETCSILSPKYRFNRNNLTTDLGKTKISDDD